MAKFGLPQSAFNVWREKKEAENFTGIWQAFGRPCKPQSDEKIQQMSAFLAVLQTELKTELVGLNLKESDGRSIVVHTDDWKYHAVIGHPHDTNAGMVDPQEGFATIMIADDVTNGYVWEGVAHDKEDLVRKLMSMTNMDNKPGPVNVVRFE